VNEVAPAFSIALQARTWQAENHAAKTKSKLAFILYGKFTMMSPQNEFIRRLRTKLLTWYRQNARDLPWRRTKEPYRIWLSEVMLQQTQVSTVVPYYRRFLQALPDVRQLATASEDRVLKLWEGLGYYRRARLLQQAARQIVSERRGEFPASGREWREMPGVGPYMAGALASIISGERVPAVDGNVKRILSRLFAYAQEIERPGAAAWLQARAEALVPARRPGDFNQALMDLGAGICRPRSINA
jgi:A/G-specific adenine glycosylase